MGILGHAGPSWSAGLGAGPWTSDESGMTRGHPVGADLWTAGTGRRSRLAHDAPHAGFGWATPVAYPVAQTLSRRQGMFQVGFWESGGQER